MFISVRGYVKRRCVSHVINLKFLFFFFSLFNIAKLQKEKSSKNDFLLI